MTPWLDANPTSHLHLAGFLPSVILTALWYLILRRSRVSMWRLALLAFPGALAHELAHFVVGFLLLAKPTGFSVWPKRSGDRWELGSVSFRGINLLNGAWVALAPLLLLPLARLFLNDLVAPLWVDHRWGGWLAAGYLTATFLFASLPSLQDIREGGRSLIVYGVLGGIGWFWGGSIRQIWFH